MEKPTNKQKWKLKNIAIIEYPFNVGGQLVDRWLWMMTINGVVKDYHTKEELIKQAKEKGINWIVIRRHKYKNKDRFGELTIMQKGGKISNLKR